MPKFLISVQRTVEKILSRTQIRMLHYLVKHERPNIANQQLPKLNDGAYPAAFCEFLSTINYVLDTKNLGLKLEPSRDARKPWKIIWFSNSDNARDPISRRNISGFLLHVLGVTVSWQLKSKRCITQLSSEAEWVSFSEAVKEAMFMITC